MVVIFVAHTWDTVEKLIGAEVAGRALAGQEGLRWRLCSPPGPTLYRRACAGDHPAQSRAAPVLRVPDISQHEAVEYLAHLGVQGKQAEQVGHGRMAAPAPVVPPGACGQ